MIINSFLWIGGVVPVETTIIGKFVEINATSYNITGIDSNSSIESIFVNSTQTAVVTDSPFGVVSTLYLIWDFLIILMGFFFAPLWALQSANAPITVIVLFGIPLVIVYIVAIVSFIKGKDL